MLHVNSNKIIIFDFEKKLIDGDTINPRDLVSIKCYIGYWRHFASKRHGLTLELATIKLLDHANTIKYNYDAHNFII